MGGGCRFFHHGGVLLRALIHPVDSGVDLLQPRCLLLRSADNSADIAVDLLHLCDDLFQGFSGLADQGDAVFHVAVRSVDQFLDFLRSLGGTLRQFAHLLGNDSKALACFTGAGGFDTGIQRKQVGLEGDFIDDTDDAADFGGGGFDLAHGVDRTPDDTARTLRAVLRLSNELPCFLGLVARVGDRGGDFLQRGGGFFNGCGLLFGPLGEIVRGRSDLLCAGGDSTRVLGNLLHGSAELFDRGIEVGSELFQRGDERRVDLLREVAVCQRLQCIAKLADSPVGLLGKSAAFVCILLEPMPFCDSPLGFRVSFPFSFCRNGVAQAGHGARKLADLITSRFEATIAVEIALRHRFQRKLQSSQRTDDRARGNRSRNDRKKSRDTQRRQHDRLEAACRAANLAANRFVQCFLIIDEFIDGAQPGNEGRPCLFEQDLASRIAIALFLERNNLSDQRIGFRLYVGDLAQNGLFLIRRTCRRCNHIRHALFILGVGGGQLFDQCLGRLALIGRGHQRDVANCNRPIVHAAAIVDGKPLLDAVDVVDRSKVAVDLSDLYRRVDAQAGHQHNQEAETKGETHCDPETFKSIHCHAPSCWQGLSKVSQTRICVRMRPPCTTARVAPKAGRASA